MQVRRRSGDMTKIVGQGAKNTVTNRKDGDTQVKYIPNSRSTPKPQGYARIKNAVCG